ncbi:hypothetical protein WG904_13040 [Pedobacter sp. Du54]|uniref:hypothetical protein n=1 Tax=Pedobacter anseongensis TaxID=3133439 RepID=UPI00309891F4
MNKLILIVFFAVKPILSFAQKNIDSLKQLKQNANLAYPQLYKENSELSYTSPFGEIGAPTKYVVNGKLTTSYMVLASKALPIAFSVNPEFTVRVRNEKSAGVRTPSFKLGGTLYFRFSKNIEHYSYAELSFTHHSNGQDGSAILADGAINTLNGNFSTNYLTTNYRFGHYTDKLLNGDYYGLHHKIGLQWHKWFAYEPALAGDFGFTRINYDISFRVYQNPENDIEKEKWRINGSISYAINSLTNYQFFASEKRLNAELSVNYSFPFMQNVFLMATFGYYGEDPYNIYFNDKYAYARFGISSTFSRWKLKKT